MANFISQICLIIILVGFGDKQESDEDVRNTTVAKDTVYVMSEANEVEEFTEDAVDRSGFEKRMKLL